MIIAFVHNHNQFSPELEAYIRFFSARHIACESVDKNDLGLVHRHVEWWMTGTDITKPREGIFKIHEYNTASWPPFRKWKDGWKSFFNTQPDFRLFLNEYVKKALHFHDRIPFGFRNMGVPEHWLGHDAALHNKEYDFVYTGNLSPLRQPEKLLNCFSTGALRNKTLLLISRDYEPLQQAYSHYPNIVFMGPLPHSIMDACISKARFGINYVIDIEPFNHQASVKLLEYAALGLPVISSRYVWMEQFQQRFGGNYFYLEPDFSNFTWENITHCNYRSPDLSAWTWERQIQQCGVLEFLASRFPEMSF